MIRPPPSPPLFPYPPLFRSLASLEQRALLLRAGVACGRMRALPVRAAPASWFTLGEPAIEPLSVLGCILMRKDPPFDTEYVYSTYILERAESEGVLIVNRPRGLRDMNEKVYTAWFPQCCAPTLITRDMGEMAGFLRERSEEHTSELQSQSNLVCRLLLDKKTT